MAQTPPTTAVTVILPVVLSSHAVTVLTVLKLAFPQTYLADSICDWQSKGDFVLNTPGRTHCMKELLSCTYLSFSCTMQYQWRANDTTICLAETVKDGILKVCYNKDCLKFWGIRISKLFYCIRLYVGHFNFLGRRGKRSIIQTPTFFFGPLREWSTYIFPKGFVKAGWDIIL